MEATLVASSKRPKLVWVICAFTGFSAVFIALSYYLVYSGAIPLTPAQEQYLGSLSSLDRAVSFTIAAINLSAATFLFLLRRHAAPLFTLGLSISVLTGIWHALYQGWPAAVGGSVSGTLIGWGISLAVCLYAWRLVQRGVLT
jgi:hypothetical protein